LRWNLTSSLKEQLGWSQVQFDLLRAFPYPVLRPNVNDYMDGDIQATVTFEHMPGDTSLRAEIKFALSVPEITSLVTEGKASYAVVFACRDTYFRKAVFSSLLDFDQTFASGTLRGEVIIYPYVVATSDIEGFACEWINEEFGKGSFKFAEGSVLALEEPRAIYVDREAFKPISSAFVLVANENLTDHKWRIDPANEKVFIQVSPVLKELIDAARGVARNKAVLLNSIYFEAVMQCLSYLKQPDSEHDTRRWAFIIRQKCQDMNLDLTMLDEAIVAQRLMKYPFSLVETYCLKETGE